MEVIHSVDPDRLTASRPEGDSLWLDLEAPSDRDRLWLAELLELPPRWLDVASRPGHRPLIDHDWVLLAATGARVRAGHGADSVDVRVGLRGSVLLTRVHGSLELPARFTLAANGNLCPCGGWPASLPRMGTERLPPGVPVHSREAPAAPGTACRPNGGAAAGGSSRVSEDNREATARSS